MHAPGDFRFHTRGKSLCSMLDRGVPDELDVHIALDHSSTHKMRAIQKLLIAHPRFVVYFTPTSSS